MPKNIPYNTYSHNFGILIPENSGVTFTHQSGGMYCNQIDLEGIFLPLNPPKMHLPTPEWANWDESVSEIDLTSENIPERDFNSFPEWVQERGHFYNTDEYFHWLNQDRVDWYGHLDLLKEQRMWNYPSGELLVNSHGYNPMDKWDSIDQIWSEINERLPFEYEEFKAFEYRRKLKSQDPNQNINLPIPDGYPEQGAAFKWIKIIGSKQDKRGRFRAPWAEKLKSKYVILTYDNSD